jgi:hypothetical protein
MRLLIGFTVVALTLATAATAKGKQLKSATICGANACTTVTDQERLRELPVGGQDTAPPPPPAAYYTMEFVVGTGGAEESRWLVLYVPSENIVGANGEVPGTLTWLPAYGSAIFAMMRATRGLEPFRVPTAWPTDVRRVTPGPAPHGFDWPLVSGSLLVAFALGLTALVLVKRGREVLPHI